jgi:hypothetical protein
MAKRLHDNEIWNKLWFRNLSIEAKLLWLFIKDKCNFAGIWETDFSQASFYIGKKIRKESLTELSKQFKYINNTKIFLLDFIEFQYGTEKKFKKSTMYSVVLNELEKYSIVYPIDTVCNTVGDTVKEKEMVKDKEKEMVKDKEEEKTWYNDYPTYLKEVGASFDLIINDWNWIALMKRYNPTLKIRLTLEKAFNTFWGTEAGWKHKQRKKINSINWKSTWENALSLSANKVYLQKGETDTELEEIGKRKNAALN